MHPFSEAVKLILDLWRNPAKAPELIRAYEIMFGLTEVLIEAGPTTLIIVVILYREPDVFLDMENPFTTSLLSNDFLLWILFLNFISFFWISQGPEIRHLPHHGRYRCCRSIDWEIPRGFSIMWSCFGIKRGDDCNDC